MESSCHVLENRLASATWVRIPSSPFTKTAPGFRGCFGKNRKGIRTERQRKQRHKVKSNRSVETCRWHVSARRAL